MYVISGLLESRNKEKLFHQRNVWVHTNGLLEKYSRWMRLLSSESPSWARSKSNLLGWLEKFGGNTALSALSWKKSMLRNKNTLVSTAF